VKLLVCGTRVKKLPVKLIQDKLDEIKGQLDEKYLHLEIIEGCCKDSADEIAEMWAQDKGVTVHHFPSTSGNYLRRNVEMVDKCDAVLAFWNGFSYGTAHTVAQGLMKGKDVKIIEVTGYEHY